MQLSDLPDPTRIDHKPWKLGARLRVALKSVTAGLGEAASI
jgi:hypothetical protein